MAVTGATADTKQETCDLLGCVVGRRMDLLWIGFGQIGSGLVRLGLVRSQIGIGQIGLGLVRLDWDWSYWNGPIGLGLFKLDWDGQI